MGSTARHEMIGEVFRLDKIGETSPETTWRAPILQGGSVSFVSKRGYLIRRDKGDPEHGRGTTLKERVQRSVIEKTFGFLLRSTERFR